MPHVTVDKQQDNGKNPKKISSPASFSVNVPESVKVDVNNPRKLCAICWNTPTFLNSSAQPSDPPVASTSPSAVNTSEGDALLSSVDHSDDNALLSGVDHSDENTLLSGVDHSDEDLPASSLSETNDSSGHSAPEDSVLKMAAGQRNSDLSNPSDNNRNNPDNSSNVLDGSANEEKPSIRYLDDIMIESGVKISLDDDKLQMPGSLTTLRSMEEPISESIYAPAKFETNVNTSRLGKRFAYLSKHHHSFIGLRYTTYDPTSKRYSRKRISLGAYYDADGKKKKLLCCNDTNAKQVIGTQSDISYDKLVEVMKSIPRYFKENEEFHAVGRTKEKTNNCNSLVYRMAKIAGLDDVSKLHNTFSPDDAAKNILHYLQQNDSDLTRINIKFDGVKHPILKCSFFIHNTPGIHLGLTSESFQQEVPKNLQKKNSQAWNWRQTLRTYIDEINENPNPIDFIHACKEKNQPIQQLIVALIRTSARKFPRFAVYLGQLLNYFQTVANELGLEPDVSHPFFDSLECDHTVNDIDFLPSPETAVYFKNSVNPTLYKEYTENILSLDRSETQYNKELRKLIAEENERRPLDLGYSLEESKTFAETVSKKQTIRVMIVHGKNSARYLNATILGKYSELFSDTLSKLKTSADALDASSVYTIIESLYRMALNDHENQDNLADLIDSYSKIYGTKKYDSISQARMDLLYHFGQMLKPIPGDLALDVLRMLDNNMHSFEEMMRQAVEESDSRRNHPK